jgi:hypothetical protein
MRLMSIVPDQRFNNLDLRLFECSCGVRVSDVAARRRGRIDESSPVFGAIRRTI